MQDDLFRRVKEEAKFQGTSFNAYVVEILTEKIQDEEDYHEAMAVLKEGNESISREEMIRKYG